MKNRLRYGAAVLAAAAFLGACGDSGDSTAKSEGPVTTVPEAPAAPDDGLLTATLPPDIPLPESYVVHDSYTLDSENGRTALVNFSVPGTAAEMQSFYERALADNGWTVDVIDATNMSIEKGERSGMLQFAVVETGDLTVYITVDRG